MKINNEILVGVDAPALCQYWETLKNYIGELILEYPELENNSNLEGFIVTMSDDILYQKYYVLYNNIHYLYILSIDKSGKNKKWNIYSNYKDIQSDINKNNYILNIDYFINNN